MASKPKANNRDFTELGVSGVQVFNGIISGEEYNQNLVGRRALAIWDEMRRSDASVKMTLKAINEPVKALTWFMTAASDDDKDVEVAQFIERNIKDILRWKTVLGEILTYLPFGYSVFEKVLGYQVLDGYERIVLERLAFRKQRSIAKWEAGKGVAGVTQYGAGGSLIPIPLERIVVFTNEQEGDNYEGQSNLRAAYKHWFYKDKFYQIDAIGAERQALGVVDIAYPVGATPEQIAKAEAYAQNIRANEKGFISHATDWAVTFMDMQAGTLKDIEPSINHHDLQISKNVLAPFLNLGSGTGSGSRAVGDTQKELFENAVQAVADHIADTVNLYVIKDLVDLNFNVTEYPKLTVSRVAKANLPEITEAIKTLVDAGVLHPTEQDEVHARNLLGLPDMPEEVSDSNDEDDDLDDLDDKLDDAALDQAKKASAALTGVLYGNTQRAA